jgi:tRNA dimethylallyltransferase
MISKESSKENKSIKAVIICGPTGSGKSSLAMKLAAHFGGQIVSADSRQIYRRLDIGTAKPTIEDRAKIPHHLIDIADVTENFTAKQYAEMASVAIERVNRDGDVTFIVGGAGLYLSALTKGLFEGPPRDEKLRTQLEERLSRFGPSELHSELAQIDPASAICIPPSNSVRIIRALEVFRLTGKTISQLKTDGKYINLDAEYLWLGLDYPREILYRQIDQRVDSMIKTGLIDEVRGLMQDGLGPILKSKKIVGYFEIINALDGALSIDEAILLIKQHSRNYAKRQLTWFRNKAKVRWINPENNRYMDDINIKLEEYLGKMS